MCALAWSGYSLGMLKVVPALVSTPPGVKVWSCPSTNSVVPSRTVAVMEGWSLSVITGRPTAFNVDVSPFTTKFEPDPSTGILYVVPALVSTPPGVNVWSFPKTFRSWFGFLFFFFLIQIVQSGSWSSNFNNHGYYNATSRCDSGRLNEAAWCRRRCGSLHDDWCDRLDQGRRLVNSN